MKRPCASAMARSAPHVGQLAVQVHGQDAHGAVGDSRAHRGRIDEARRGLDVDELRLRAQVQDGVGGAREGHRRGDHLVAGAHVVRAQRHEKPHGARVGPDHVRRGRALAAAHQVRAELALERRDLGAQRQEESVEDLAPRRGLVLAELVAVELDLGQSRRHGATPARRAASRRSTGPGGPSRPRAGTRTASSCTSGARRDRGRPRAARKGPRLMPSSMLRSVLKPSSRPARSNDTL